MTFRPEVRAHSENGPHPFWTVASTVAILRLCLGPVAFALIVAGERELTVAALACVAAGYAAQIADYFRFGPGASDADKCFTAACGATLRLSVFLALFARGTMSGVALAAVYFPEMFVPYLRSFVRQRKQELGMRWTEQLKTIVQAVAQVVVLGILAGVAAGNATVFAVWASIAVALIFFLDHLVVGIGLLQRRMP